MVYENQLEVRTRAPHIQLVLKTNPVDACVMQLLTRSADEACAVCSMHTCQVSKLKLSAGSHINDQRG